MYTIEIDILWPAGIWMALVLFVIGWGIVKFIIPIG